MAITHFQCPALDISLTDTKSDTVFLSPMLLPLTFAKRPFWAHAGRPRRRPLSARWRSKGSGGLWVRDDLGVQRDALHQPWIDPLSDGPDGRGFGRGGSLSKGDEKPRGKPRGSAEVRFKGKRPKHRRKAMDNSGVCVLFFLLFFCLQVRNRGIFVGKIKDDANKGNHVLSRLARQGHQTCCLSQWSRPQRCFGSKP